MLTTYSFRVTYAVSVGEFYLTDIYLLPGVREVTTYSFRITYAVSVGGLYLTDI